MKVPYKPKYKPCLNVRCSHEEITTIGFEGMSCAHCRFCGMRGPQSSTLEGATRLWNDLPRGDQHSRREMLDKIIYEEYNASDVNGTLSYEALGLKYNCATSTICRRINRHMKRLREQG